jgi:hypothetical protein
MTIVRGRHVCCDGAHDAAPLFPLGSPEVAEWETIEIASGPAIHLCPACQDRCEGGVLAEALVVECADCGRNNVHDPEIERWWAIVDAYGAALSLCEDCHG